MSSQGLGQWDGKGRTGNACVGKHLLSSFPLITPELFLARHLSTRDKLYRGLGGGWTVAGSELGQALEPPG